MPIARFQMPDGRIGRFEVPEGTTPEAAQALIASSLQESQATQPAKQEATMADRANSAIGGVNRGIAGLAGMAVDTAENITNLGIAGFGAARQALTGTPGPDLVQAPGASRDWMKLMEAAGIGTTNPRPDDAASRLLHTGGMIAGGSVVPGAGVKSTLASATGGAVAGETLGPEWTGVGALTPSSARQAAVGVKNAVAARAAPTLETFKGVGAMPTVGQAIDNVFLHGIENLAAKFPGGAGVMKPFITRQQENIGATARTKVPTEAAGRAIESGITGDGGFLDRTKATWNALDNAVAAKIPKDAGVSPSNALKVLEEMTSPTPGAEKTSMVMSTPKLAEIRKSMVSDLSGKPPERVITLLKEDGRTPLLEIPIGGTPGRETMPYQAIRELRSKVGAMLDNAIVTGIPGGELKRLYGALSKDMEAAAKNAGAGNEFARQNNYYRSRMMRIENVLDRVIGKGKQPEDIFKAFNPSDLDQANKARAVMRSLQPAERKIVTEAVVNRLGRAMPGKQNEFGEVFSTETFLTNWNKLSDPAKAQLFPDPPMRDNISRIAKTSSLIRSGSGVYANPSGTAGSFAAYSVYASPIAALASGSVAPLVAAGGAAGAAYLGAKMMTSPKVVEWLAKPVNPSRPAEAISHLARLVTIYNTSKDPELKQELADYIKAISSTGEQPQ